MTTISPGIISLADQRACVENQNRRQFSAFRLEHEETDNNTNLYLFNDELLAPEATNGFYTTQKGYLIIIPITGTINYFDENENETAIEVGESMMVFLECNAFVKLTNPYEKDLISYLVIGIKQEHTVPSSPVFSTLDLSKKNSFTTLTPTGAPFKICMAQFTGRGENELAVDRHVFFYAYILAGAFEIEGRLLHDRDGLHLWDTEKVDMEALSNHATIITLELPS